MNIEQLEMQLEMVQTERDQMQQDLQQANDTILEQRRYIRNCKAVIKQLRPSLSLADNGELQQLPQEEELRDMKTQQQVLQELQLKQQNAIEDQIKADRALKEVQKWLENIQGELRETRFEAEKDAPIVQQTVEECRFFVQEYQKQLRKFREDNEYSKQRARYEEVIRQQRETISKYQTQGLKDHKAIQRLQHELDLRDERLHDLKVKLVIIEKQQQFQESLKQNVETALHQYERAFYQNQLSGGSSDPGYQAVKKQIDKIQDETALSEQTQADNERLIGKIAADLQQLKSSFHQELTDLQISYKRLYADVISRKQASQQIHDISQQKITLLEAKLTSLFEILNDLSNNQINQLRFERANTDSLHDLVHTIDTQLKLFQDKPLVQKSMDVIEQNVRQYRSQQAEMLDRLQDSEKQLTRLRGELMQISRDASEVQRTSKVAEAEFKARLDGVKAATLAE